MIWNPIQRKLKPSAKQVKISTTSEVSTLHGAVCILIRTRLCHHHNPSVPADATEHSLQMSSNGTTRTKSIEWVERTRCWRFSYVLFWSKKEDRLVLVIFWYKKAKFLVMQVVPWVVLRAAIPKRWDGWCSMGTDILKSDNGLPFHGHLKPFLTARIQTWRNNTVLAEGKWRSWRPNAYPREIH